MINGHGNDIYLYGSNKVKLDFSSNVAERQVPKSLLRFMSSRLESIAAYPEPDSVTLRKLIGEKYSLEPDRIFVTNGSVEAFYIIASAYRQNRSLVFIPSFAEYEDACRMNEHQLEFKNNHLFNDDFSVVPDVVWIGNPNNPDGHLIDIELIKEKLIRYPDTIFVVDEAYGDLCLGFQSAVNLLPLFDNLIVIHSMTKQYTLPGLRLGYMMTGKTVAERLKLYRVPWSVNVIAQQVGSFIYQHEILEVTNMENALLYSTDLQRKLSKLSGIEVVASPCTFFLIRFSNVAAQQVKEYLIEEHGLLIRDASNFRGLDKHFIRISSQSEDENEQLYLAIKNFPKR